MITRLYIDNYKCFSNFTYEPQNLDLLIGKNGSGKTSIFDVLLDLKRIAVEGEPVEDVLMVPSLNAWDQQELQTFELTLSDGSVNYLYRLQVQHNLKIISAESKRNQFLLMVKKSSIFLMGKVSIFEVSALIQKRLFFHTQTSFLIWHYFRRGVNLMDYVPSEIYLIEY